MLQIKYLLLPFFIWSLLQPVGPYKTTHRNSPASSRLLQHEISISPYNYLRIAPVSPPSKGSFLPPYPHALSFLNMQHTAEEETEEPVGPIKNMVQYEAKDSVIFDIQQKTSHLYGASDIVYEDMKLEADHIALDWSSNTILATGKQNEAGEIERKPIFTQGNIPYIAEEIRYNFDSKRGTARKLFTKQEEAIIQCDKAKMDTEDTYYTDRIKYTTCNLVKPHYYIKARKVKFVRDEYVAAGPFQFYFDDVPTPLGFFYGLFFIPDRKSVV